MPSNYISDYFQVTTTQYSRYNWNGSCASDGRDVWTYDPSCWSLAYSFPSGSSATLDPKLKPAYLDEYQIGYEKRLSDQFAASGTFVWRKQKEAIDWYDPSGYGYYYITNVPKQAIKDGYDLPDKISEYQALQLELRKRFGPDGFQFIANFTYSFKNDAWANDWRSVGAFVFTSPEAMNKLWYGRSTGKQYLHLAGSYTMPWKTVIGVNAYWTDGNVYTPYTYVGATVTAIPLAERGSSTVGNNWESDLYLEQPYKLGPVTLALYANVYNMFNNQQPTSRGGLADTASTFNKPTAWQTPRSVQLGFKIEY
jgi:hypothetical protein